MGITRGGNRTGRKWNKGGGGARGRSLYLDMSEFEQYAEKLDLLGADLQKVIGDAMEQAAETIQEDVEAAMAKGNLPAGGKYSDGQTEASIIKDAKVTWRGSYGEIGIGFDKSKPGAGGFLITGTPRMRPDYKLEDIFARKKYRKKIMDQITEELQAAVDAYMGG